MWTEQSLFRLAEGVTFQSMGPGEETVLLSLGSGHLYTCNETTTSFLEAAGQNRTFDEIVDVLAEEYEVPPSRLAADLKKLADELLAEKLIVVEQPSADRQL